MKISRTPDLLVIDDAPWLFGIILMAAIFGLLASSVISFINGNYLSALILLPIAAFVGIFVWAFVRRNQLLLDGVEGKVIHRRRTIFDHQELRYELEHLSGAIVEESSGDNGATYRMTLQISGGMDRGDHPFTMAYTSGSGAKRAAGAVNSWLAEHRR